MGERTMKKPRRFLHVIVLFLSVNFGKSLPAVAQEAPPPQPLALNVRQIESALSYLGSALSADDQRQIDDALGGADEAAAVRAIEATLDKRVLVTVGINAESRVTVKAAAMLAVTPHPEIHNLPVDPKPFFHVERARIGDTRQVPVELVVNGQSVGRKTLLADGVVRDVSFDVPIEKSRRVALRILGSAHTNPIFVVVGGKPIRPSRDSAKWCLAAVNPCWTQKAPKISRLELPGAIASYDHAREVYKRLIEECSQ